MEINKVMEDCDYLSICGVVKPENAVEDNAYNDVYYEFKIRNTVREPNVIWSSQQDFKSAGLYLEFEKGLNWVSLDATENGLYLETKQGLSIKLDYWDSDLFITKMAIGAYLEHKQLFDSIMVLKNGYVFDGEYYEDLDSLTDAVHCRINPKKEK